MRATVLRNFRLLVLPRVRVCRQTSESVRCTSRRCLQERCFTTHHFRAHRKALISKWLMCSRDPFQVQPHTVLHTHKFDGRLALSRWYRNTSPVEDADHVQQKIFHQLQFFSLDQLFAWTAHCRAGEKGNQIMTGAGCCPIKSYQYTAAH